MTKSNLRRKGWFFFPLTVPSNRSLSKAIRVGTQTGQQPGGRADAEAMEGRGAENGLFPMPVVVSGGSKFGTLYLFLWISVTVEFRTYLRQGTLTLDCG